MRYSNTLIAVRDMEASLKFYRELFELEVTMDLGWCKTLNCGLTLQAHFDEIAGFFPESMTWRTHNMELYFETENFDAFLAELDRHPEVERLHGPKTYPWLQRGIHIYDPSGHLIEVSESMYSVACREFRKGRTTEKTAERIQHPVAVVRRWYEQYTGGDGRKNISCCGSDCAACEYQNGLCGGCNETQGKPFYSPEEPCPIYRCAVMEQGRKSCAGCERLPCGIWQTTRDPNFTDEAFAESIRQRIERLMLFSD